MKTLIRSFQRKTSGAAWIALLLLALPGWTPGGPAEQAIRYEPGTARYEQNITLSSPPTFADMGVPSEIKNRLILTTTISAVPGRSDSLRLVVVVDTASTSGAENLMRGGQLVPAGTRIERNMTPWGKSSSEIRNTDQLIAGIVPALVNNARLGSVWDDTTSVDLLGLTGMQGLRGQLVRSYLVSKDTVYEGEAAWKIDMGSKTTVAASTASGFPIRVDGSGDGRGVAYLSKAGTLLFSSESQTQTLNVRLPNSGSGLPLEMNTVRTVRRIR